MSAAVVVEAQVIQIAPSAPVKPVEQVSQDRAAGLATPSSPVQAPEASVHEEQDVVDLGQKEKPAICSTHIPCATLLSPTPSYSRPSPPAPQKPFLKPGVHGRRGDFTNDPDRLTGHGHQVEPADLARRRAYDARYMAFHRRFPFFPFVDRDKSSRDSARFEGLEELNREELWMRTYRDRYPGEVVGSLWDCGCEMVADGDESEEE